MTDRGVNLERKSILDATEEKKRVAATKGKAMGSKKQALKGRSERKGGRTCEK